MQLPTLAALDQHFSTKLGGATKRPHFPPRTFVQEMVCQSHQQLQCVQTWHCNEVSDRTCMNLSSTWRDRKFGLSLSPSLVSTQHAGRTFSSVGRSLPRHTLIALMVFNFFIPGCFREVRRQYTQCSILNVFFASQTGTHQSCVHSKKSCHLSIQSSLLPDRGRFQCNVSMTAFFQSFLWPFGICSSYSTTATVMGIPD